MSELTSTESRVGRILRRIKWPGLLIFGLLIIADIAESRHWLGVHLVILLGLGCAFYFYFRIKASK